MPDQIYILSHNIDQIFDDKRFSIILSSFVDFYKSRPWNEYLFCENCEGKNNFEVRNTIGFEEAAMSTVNRCQKCGKILRIFWDKERTKLYLEQKAKNKDFLLIYVVKNEQVIGMIWGYSASIIKELTESINTLNAFYIDVVCVLKELRRARGILNRMREINFILKMRLSPVHISIFDYIFKILGAPIIAKLYLNLFRQSISKGYRLMITRTHVNALGVKRLLKLAGFKEMNIRSDLNKEREFWSFKL